MSMNIRPVFTMARRPRRHSCGFTLIELMVAMLLGLIVIAGISSVFLANVKSFRSNTALSNVQSNARTAFTMMARDIRGAGFTGCNSRMYQLAGGSHVANVLNNGPNAGGTKWWADWSLNSVHGFGSQSTVADSAIQGQVGDTNGGAPATNTDSLMLLSATGTGARFKPILTPGASFILYQADPNLEAGDIAMVCDPNQSAMLQITGVAGTTVSHAANAGTPGNCSTILDYRLQCATTSVSPMFSRGGMIYQLSAVDWYIGQNKVGGTSLYRLSLTNGTTVKAQEMVRNVTGMQITYHMSGNQKFVTAANVTSWPSVDAVHIVFTLKSPKNPAGRRGVGTNGKALTRTFASTISIRNRT